MTRRTLVISALALGGCFQAHPTGQRELEGNDCYSCHADNYVATTAPAHGAMPQIYATRCASCHRNTGWSPALEGLHSDVFVIASGAHAPIECLACHDLDRALPSAQGANTSCIQCHPDDADQKDIHAGTVSATRTPYAYLDGVPNFCLSCHPRGTALKHPDNLFARRDPHAVPCAACHDRTSGPDTKGDNVTCVASGCHHTLNWADAYEHHRDADYTRARGDGTLRNFCHRCHS